MHSSSWIRKKGTRTWAICEHGMANSGQDSEAESKSSIDKVVNPVTKTTISGFRAPSDSVGNGSLDKQSAAQLRLPGRDLHSTGCGTGQLSMGECGCGFGWEETCVCAGCGRIKKIAGLPQNRNYLNIKCLKHINCYLSFAQKQKEQLILTLKWLTCAN